MVSALIGLLVLVLVAGLIWWAITLIPLPQPARIIITVIFVIILVVALLSYLPAGHWGILR